jgi:hypothetical protein
VKRTNVYVDGFNLYYGIGERTSPYRWLDLRTLCHLLLPDHEIGRIRYFTSIIEDRPKDPGQVQRQLTFIRSLEACGVEVHYGSFESRKKRRRLVRPQLWRRMLGLRWSGLLTARIWQVVEKGSDVNLASYLLWDGFNNEYDCAVVISNDSDLAEPFRIVRHELGKELGLLNPQRGRSTDKLRQQVLFCKQIREGALRAAQLPDTLSDAHGVIHRPREWARPPS